MSKEEKYEKKKQEKEKTMEKSEFDSLQRKINNLKKENDGLKRHLFEKRA